ncbi:MAG TPA: O-antigen ligase family protein [Candidatus Limnocylindrales bacterium]|nr:O-antigen ligase family protein [Candidatus Limnocylindrales bacterium]
MTPTAGMRRGIPTTVPPLWAALLAVDAIIVAVAVVIGGPLLALAAVLGLATVLVSVRYPGILFAAYLLLAFYKGGVQPFSPVDITLILAGLNGLQLLVLLRGRRLWSISAAGIGLWVGLTLLILGGVLYAPDQNLALDRAIRWWTLVFFPIVGGGLRVGTDLRYLRQFLWSFFAMGMVTVLLGLTQLSNVERLTVLNTNTIQVSRAALLVPLLGVTFVLRERFGLARLALIGAIPAALLVALASGSRGPLLFLAFLTAVGLIRYFAHPRSVNWLRVVISVVMILGSILALSIVAQDLPRTALDRFTLFGDFVQSALSGDLTTSLGDTSAGNRIVLFRAAESMFGDHPVLGVGTSGFEALAPRYMSPDEVEAWPHNALLQVAAEFGLVGLGIVLSLLYLVMRRRLPPGHEAWALRILFVFFFLNALVSGDIFSDRETWGLWMLVLLVDAPRLSEVVPAIRGRPAPVAGFGAAAVEATG